MTTQQDMEVLLRERSAQTGSIADAVSYAGVLLQSPEQRSAAVDVFPATRLAGALGKLCRCRGMIQEVQPELHLFCASRQHFFTHGSHSDATPREEEEDVVYMDAVSLYVIPVPGNTHFYDTDAPQRASGAAHATCSPTLRKRVERDAPALAPTPEGASVLSEERLHKPPRRAMDGSTGCTAAADAVPGASRATGPSLNLPHTAAHQDLHAACVITVLLGTENGARRNPFRVNDVVDFYGYQHFPQDQLEVGESDDLARFSAWNATELSRGLVSRLRCLSYAPLSTLPVRHRIGGSALATAGIAESRAAAVAHLRRTVTGDDALVAEYLLLHLCSRVHSHSASTPVGDLPLRISGTGVCPAAWSSQLRDVVPVAEVLLSGEVLRQSPQVRLTPAYHNELNYLQTGLLQVANGTHLTVDCASLIPLDDAWYEGLFAVVHKQQLPLEYPYHTLELPVDVAVLALDSSSTTDAVHPLFQFALHVRWAGAAPAAEATAEEDGTRTAAAVREYLDAVRCLEATVPEDESISEVASRALVAMAAEMPGWNNRDPLLHNNTFSAATALMRAHAASHGRSCFAAEDVAAVYDLERARMARWGGSDAA